MQYIIYSAEHHHAVKSIQNETNYNHIILYKANNKWYKSKYTNGIGKQQDLHVFIIYILYMHITALYNILYFLFERKYKK